MQITQTKRIGNRVLLSGVVLSVLAIAPTAVSVLYYVYTINTADSNDQIENAVLSSMRTLAYTTGILIIGLSISAAVFIGGIVLRVIACIQQHQKA